MARSVPGIVFNRGDITLETIIAEIVDNSLDAKAKKIEIEFFEYKSSGQSQDIGFAVFDDGKGFADIEGLFDSFEIEEKTGKKERAADDIGKYHIGLKIAPLTMFKELHVLSKVDDEILFSSAFNPNKSGLDYDMDQTPRVNPTYPSMYHPKLSQLNPEIHQVISKFIKTHSAWKTCVIGCHRIKNILDDGNKPIDLLVTGSSGPKHFAQFLGMTYQKYLEDAEPPMIQITNCRKDSPYKIHPIDPFWKDFTPSKFREKQIQFEHALSKASDDEEELEIQTQIDFCKSMARYGTYKGYTHVSSKIDGIKVTPYVIPVGEARTIIAKNTIEGIRWNNSTTTRPMHRAVTNASSELLASNRVTGFFFYRGKRLINFGKFYELNVKDNDANSIRIEVEYPKELDDTHFEVSPNKERIDNFSEETWADIIRALKQSEGGPEYAAPFNVERPFFIDTIIARKEPTKKKRKPNPEAHFPNILVRSGEGGAKYKKCSACGFLHNPDDNDEICLKFVCAKCSEKNHGCTPTTCHYTCSVCTAKGECKPGNCVNVCKFCKLIHEEESCKKICPGGCGKPAPDCICTPKEVCDGCNKDKCECFEGESGMPLAKGPKVKLTLYRKNKEKNVELLKSALERLDIQPDELA